METLQEKIKLFHVKQYDPKKVTDKQLNDDFRLIAAKYATMKRGGKTEFANLKELYDFGVIVLKEIVGRGKLTFHPEWKIIDEKAVIGEPNA